MQPSYVKERIFSCRSAAAGVVPAATVVVAAARAAGGRGAAAAAADQNDDNDEPQAGVLFKAHERRSPHFFESELSYACFLQDET